MPGSECPQIALETPQTKCNNSNSSNAKKKYPPASLVGLPVELKIAILHCVPSLSALHALQAAHPSFNQLLSSPSIRPEVYLNALVQEMYPAGLAWAESVWCDIKRSSPAKDCIDFAFMKQGNISRGTSNGIYDTMIDCHTIPTDRRLQASRQVELLLGYLRPIRAFSRLYLQDLRKSTKESGMNLSEATLPSIQEVDQAYFRLMFIVNVLGMGLLMRKEFTIPLFSVTMDDYDVLLSATAFLFKQIRPHIAGWCDRNPRPPQHPDEPYKDPESYIIHTFLEVLDDFGLMGTFEIAQLDVETAMDERLWSLNPHEVWHSDHLTEFIERSRLQTLGMTIGDECLWQVTGGLGPPPGGIWMTD